MSFTQCAVVKSYQLPSVLHTDLTDERTFLLLFKSIRTISFTDFSVIFHSKNVTVVGTYLANDAVLQFNLSSFCMTGKVY